MSFSISLTCSTFNTGVQKITPLAGLPAACLSRCAQSNEYNGNASERTAVVFMATSVYANTFRISTAPQIIKRARR